MSLTPCIDCGELANATRCQPCQRGLWRDQDRPTTTTRGYGADHQAARGRAATQVANGTAKCARCNDWISPDDDWHLDHTDDRKAYLGPSHAWCNLSAANKTNKD